MKILFDYTKLIDKIYSEGCDAATVADILGITERDLMRRIAGIEEFTQDEIHLLSQKVLKINPIEITEYFFKMGGGTHN